jgi:hypothetical protein
MENNKKGGRKEAMCSAGQGNAMIAVNGNIAIVKG